MSFFKILIFCSLFSTSYSSTHHLFKEVQTPFPKNVCLITEPLDLLRVAKSTLHYFLRHDSKGATDPEINSLLFEQKQNYLSAIKKTLSFLIKSIEEDKPTGKYRICNPEFLQKHFTIYQWEGDRIGALKHGIELPEHTIRLTEYLVFKVKGSPIKTAEFPCALYAVPLEEKNLTEQEIENKKETLMRFRYTKHDVVGGIYEQKHMRSCVKPLVWISRESLEEALMQGTIVVEMANKQHHMFNVDRNNGIIYDRTLKDRTLQKRYWYFKELHSFKGYGTAHSKITIKPNVTFAGDVKHIGLGQLIALSYENPKTKKSEMRLGIIADKGGAFENNLYQLDYFVGIFESRQSFKDYISSLPAFTSAYIMIKK
jgi:hypothetical protein